MRKVFNISIVIGSIFFLSLSIWILTDIKKCISRSELSNIFNLSLNDIDFSEEITGSLGYSAKYTPAAVNSGESEYNKLRRWGIRRAKNHQIPRADPGTPELLKKYAAIYIGDIKIKKIYLTFDEGYENGYTPKILDTLSRNGVKAVFFITGPYLNEHQDLVRRMLEEGHEVGNHTVRHLSLPTLSEEKIEKEVLELERTFKEKFRKTMLFLRPPKGEYSEKTLAVTRKLGYVNLFWSFAYNDWDKNKQKGWEYAYNKVMENLHNGAVLLLHAVSKDNAEALDRIIKDARKSGYEFGDIRELVNLQGGGSQ